MGEKKKDARPKATVKCRNCRRPLAKVSGKRWIYDTIYENGQRRRVCIDQKVCPHCGHLNEFHH